MRTGEPENLSRKPAQEYSPRRKPWVRTTPIFAAAPKG